MLPIAHDAKTFELIALDVDPRIGEFAAFLAELDNRDLVLILAFGAVLFLDLPFNWQAMAVPTGDVVGILTHHLLRPVDYVFQNFVEGVADMQITVRVGRSVVQDE